jgi:hypothetical protein
MLEWLLATTENGGKGRIASGEWSNDKNVGVAISHDRLSATTERTAGKSAVGKSAGRQNGSE